MSSFSRYFNINRLKEPSTYAALASVLGAASVLTGVPLYVAIFCGVLGVLVPESKISIDKP